MSVTAINTAPSLDSFTNLEDFQSHTPASFHDAKPVLHFHIASLDLHAHLEEMPMPAIFESVPNPDNSDDPSSPSHWWISRSVDVFVTSEKLIIYNRSISKGMEVSYTAISVHGRTVFKEQKALFLQLDYGETEDPCDMYLTVSSDDDLQHLYDAVSACSELNPDPSDEDQEMEDGTDSRIQFEGSVGYEGISGLPGVQMGSADGGLPPPFPGSGGWITAENVGDFFDEEGNWIKEDTVPTLGDGAGNVRNRDEIEGEVDGDGEQVNGVKKRRTDGPDTNGE